MKQRQEEVTRILDIYQIKYELIDISVSLKVLQEMRMKVSTPKALPPQIFNGQEYCGVRVNVHFYFVFISCLKVIYMAKQYIYGLRARFLHLYNNLIMFLKIRQCVLHYEKKHIIKGKNIMLFVLRYTVLFIIHYSMKWLITRGIFFI